MKKRKLELYITGKLMSRIDGGQACHLQYRW